MPDDIKNVFISHIHEDDEGLGKLKDLLSDNGMEIRDYSVNSDNPNNAKSEEYIKSQILAPRIAASSVLIVYITPDTKDSVYVDWEIEYAESKNKRIVGVWEWGQSGCEIPAALDKHYDAIVGWNGDLIIDAMTGDFDGYEAPDGSGRGPRPLKRHPC
jgi:MTH538 TIR-like domain (DUF1863)